TEAAVITVGSEPGSVVVRAAAGSGMTGLVGRSYRGTLAAQVMESQRSLIVEDLTSSARQEDGRSLGLGPAVVVPIVADGRPFGNLMVGALPGSRLYDAKDLAIVESFAESAGVVLALGEARSELERRHRETADQLQAALDSRVVIEQAKGVVSASRGVTVEDAFARLRAYARSHNSKLQDVASSVVRRELLP
ncbi:MAG TPA: GAF and ANTAR domain-containing protein, partial [Acidimicrobiales bacterium]|nr:GAF and ANTAR domain-containing protein [Acidimicrobiales bacterium]